MKLIIFNVILNVTIYRFRDTNTEIVTLHIYHMNICETVVARNNISLGK